MLPRTYEKYKHLIGTQINKWTVLDITEKIHKDKGYIYAKCQCECGTVREVRLSKLVNNKCFDCGCGTRERLNETTKRKYNYLLNTTINSWTILDIIPPTNTRKTFVLAQCHCGTIKEVCLSHILRERSKDCGCGRKNTLQETRTKNLVGQRFGKLVVLEMLDERNKYGRIMYKCQCDCGNIITVLGNSLMLEHTTSCGCITSYGNFVIHKFLEENKIPHETEYSVIINGRTYRFDFYLPQNNLMIEYDGQHHYMSIKYGSLSDEEAQANFENRKLYDIIKNDYCTENNIELLRIPYWERKNIETILSNHLQRLNIEGFTNVA